MAQNAIIFLAVLFINNWVWHIYNQNTIIFVLLLLTSFSLFRVSFHKKNTLIFYLLFIILLFSQIKTTEYSSLSYLDNDQQRVQTSRLGQYPIINLQLFNKNIRIPIAHWFEGRKETLTFYKLQNNLFSTLDQNIFFFGGHPRQRIAANDFNKFPITFFPFFLWGMVELIKKRSRKLFLGTFIIPLMLLTYTGQKNPFGEYIFFPFLATAITTGISKAQYTVARNFPALARFLVPITFASSLLFL